MRPITKQQQRMFTTEALGIIPSPSPHLSKKRKIEEKENIRRAFSRIRNRGSFDSLKWNLVWGRKIPAEIDTKCPDNFRIKDRNVKGDRL